MGALSPGDELFDETGKTCRVKWVSEDRHIDCYRLRFSNGEQIICDGDHLWKTQVKVNSFVRVGREMSPIGESVRGPRVREARSIFTTQRYGKRKDTNHSIDMQSPLELPECELPIPPYILGAWLGDGTSDAACITCGSQDLSNLLETSKEAGSLPKLGRIAQLGEFLFSPMKMALE